MIIHVLCRLSKEVIYFLDNHMEFSEDLGSAVSQSMQTVLNELQVSNSPLMPEDISKGVMTLVTKEFLSKYPDVTANGFFEDSETFIIDVSTSRYVHATSSQIH